MTRSADPEFMVRRFYDDVWNRWDDSAVDELLAADFVFRGSLGDEAQGRDGFRAYRDKVRRAARDFHNEITDLVANEGRVAARLEYSGHHTGLLLELPPTWVSFRYTGAAFFTVHRGLLSKAWVLGDLEALRRQLVGRR
jgi:steroid delta-isomerase-like uncharacterized protein